MWVHFEQVIHSPCPTVVASEPHQRNESESKVYKSSPSKSAPGTASRRASSQAQNPGASQVPAPIACPGSQLNHHHQRVPISKTTSRTPIQSHKIGAATPCASAVFSAVARSFEGKPGPRGETRDREPRGRRTRGSGEVGCVQIKQKPPFRSSFSQGTSG